MWSTLGISHGDIITFLATATAITIALVSVLIEELSRRGAKLAIKLLKRKFANI